MVEWLGGIFNTNTVFFLLDTLHQLFCVSILTSQDIGNAQVCEYDGCDLEKVIHLSSYEWLIIPNGILVLVVFHEEAMCHIELPSLMLTTEFRRLPEQLFHLCVVSLVPKSFGLHH